MHFVAQLSARRPGLLSAHQPAPIPIGKPTEAEGQPDEILFTTEPTVNFAQLAVRACQRAQGDKNKTMREAWVRLCGTYQSKAGPVAHREVRQVGNRAVQEYRPLPASPFRAYTTTRLAPGLGALLRTDRPRLPAGGLRGPPYLSPGASDTLSRWSRTPARLQPAQ